jgi:hypothetical protein
MTNERMSNDERMPNDETLSWNDSFADGARHSCRFIHLVTGVKRNECRAPSAEQVRLVYQLLPHERFQ